MSAAVCAAAFFSFRSASRRSASSSARSADASASAVLQTTLTFAECCGAAAHFRTSHSAGLRPRVCLERLGRAQQRLLRSFGGSQVTPVGTRLFVPLELCDACCALASLVCRCALRCRRRLVTACLCAPLLQQSECPRWLLSLRGPARSRRTTAGPKYWSRQRSAGTRTCDGSGRTDRSFPQRSGVQAPA